MEKTRHETSPSQTRLCHGVDIHIPLDLMVDILNKLPSKSLMRFQCVSKLWSSIISSRRDFIDSIVTRSLTQPQPDVHLMYHYGHSCYLASLSTANQELVLVQGQCHQGHQFVRGLICSWSYSYKNHKVVVAIYNPTTRQSIYLPEFKAMPLKVGSFLFGYDPLENQYKVLYLPYRGKDKSCQVLTLGASTANPWREIQGDVQPWVSLECAVCINETIYYREVTMNNENDRLMSFDVRSENFYHVDAPTKIQMSYDSPHYFPINYQGKLGFISCEKGVEIWVMETQGWSNIFCWETSMDGFKDHLLISGATHSGEIVFGDYGHAYVGDPLARIYYYDPKLICMRYAVLKDYNKQKGSHNICLTVNSTTFSTVPDYVENTMRLK